MLIYIGADHRGFELKNVLKKFLKEQGYELIDVGADKLDTNDDYPDYAKAVAEKVSADPLLRKGIVICGSGVGVDIVANKFERVRSVLAMSPDHAVASKNDDDTNVLAIAADFIDEDMAKKIVNAWMLTDFSGVEKHKRRLQKIGQIEVDNLKKA